MNRIITVILMVSTVMASPILVMPIKIGVNQGSVEGELFSPALFQEGPDGEVYVFDKKDDYIKVYSHKTGVFLRKIGGLGQGPGQYIRFGTFRFTNDSKIFFTEASRGHRWITFIGLHGEYIRILKYKSENIFGLSDAMMMQNDKIIGLAELSGIPEKASGLYYRSYYRWLVIIDTDGQVGKKIIEKKHVFAISFTAQGKGPSIPDFPDFLWTLTQDNHIIFSEGNSNMLEVYDLNGKKTGVITIPIADAPELNKRDLKDWIENKKKQVVKYDGIEFYKKYYSVAEKYKPYYGKKQIIQSISAFQPGYLLISRSKKKKTGEYIYHIVDRKGKMIETAKSYASSTEIGKNLILYTLLDEDENLILHCQKRNPKIKGILSQLPQ